MLSLGTLTFFGGCPLYSERTPAAYPGELQATASARTTMSNNASDDADWLPLWRVTWRARASYEILARERESPGQFRPSQPIQVSLENKADVLQKRICEINNIHPIHHQKTKNKLKKPEKERRKYE